jgi:hypothetical protein
LSLLSDDYKAGRFGDETTRIGALLLVSHGTGRHAYKNPDTGQDLTYEELTEQQREELAQQFDDDGVREELEGEVPCRIVNVITPTGLAADVSIIHRTGVMVQQVEQWLNDGEGTIPEPMGAVDNALMSTFMFMQVARECVASGEDMSFAGMLKVATELHDMQGGKQLIAFLLRILAGGLEDGIISLGEDDD